MPISFRSYTPVPGFTPEFQRVHEFLLRLNHLEVMNEGFLWGRWEWMFSLPFLDTAHLHKIGSGRTPGRGVAA